MSAVPVSKKNNSCEAHRLFQRKNIIKRELCIHVLLILYRYVLIC